MRLSVKTLVISLCLAAPSGAFAQPRGHGGPGDGPGGERGLLRAADELKLTEDQKKQIKAVHKSFRDKTDDLREAEEAAQDKFFKAMKDASATKEQLRSLNDELIKARTAMMQAHFERMLALRQILSKEQLKKFLAEHGSFGPQGHRPPPPPPGDEGNGRMPPPPPPPPGEDDL